MKYTAYLILEPGADRPYFCHTYPTLYQKRPGAQVLELELDVPGFAMVDGRIQAWAKPECTCGEGASPAEGEVSLPHKPGCPCAC